MLGLYPTASRPTATLPRKLGTPVTAVLAVAGLAAVAITIRATASSSIVSAGAGSTSFVIFGKASASMATGGAGSFANVMTALVSGTVTFQGNSTLGTTDNPASVASFSGLGALSAFGYAFYADAEKAGPAQELRVAYIPAEDRIAVVPFENRVYEVAGKSVTPQLPNRRRMI